MVNQNWGSGGVGKGCMGWFFRKVRFILLADMLVTKEFYYILSLWVE